ncbi:receptor expression-enhancing protein 1 isoform X3 [Apteryx rowi]|uniref:receptor expression-enhancing protein 1 isoform X3 n=1 Tax=Apteryx rowi TaxID=308060 RepID=UPI000E1C8E80|nr:receptor expression-enhancing protein 1 isoform X3 [Apteryx rowi]
MAYKRGILPQSSGEKSPLARPLPRRPQRRGQMEKLIFGTLYPAYYSYKAVKSKDIKEYVKWMMYWIIFALFTTAETFTDIFLCWFPFYYELKIAFVAWLLSPYTKGSSLLYRKFVHPTLSSKEKGQGALSERLRSFSMQDLSTIRGDSSSTVPPSVTVRTSSKQSQPKTSRSTSEGTGSSVCTCCAVCRLLRGKALVCSEGHMPGDVLLGLSDPSCIPLKRTRQGEQDGISIAEGLMFIQ